LALLLTVLLLPLSAAASDLHVGNPWIDLPIFDEDPPGYLAIQNQGNKPRKIVGGSSPRCETIEIHRAALKDGVMGSEKLDEIEIPAGGAVAFAPRGLFLLLVGAEKLEEDEQVSIELEFADGETLGFEAVVRED
jgi:copper(I)-binding protein